MKKEIRKWWDFYKSPTHHGAAEMKENGKWCELNTNECCTKQSLVDELKASESNVCSDSKPKPNKGNDKGNQIIDTKPSATVATTNVYKTEPKDLEEGERLFHSYMWVKDSSLQFIFDSGSQKNLILVEVMKQRSWTYWPHYTHIHRSLGGFTKDEISVLANSAAFPTSSSPSWMSNYVMLLLLKFVMCYYANHTCGRITLCMSYIIY